MELTPLFKQHQQLREQQYRSRKQQEEHKIAALEKAVEEKLKSKKKITNEDLLVFQRR